jgi:hypothetical protein
MARNQTTPFERLGQTSLFRFPVGKLVSLQEKFRADPQKVADEYEFEQRFVTRNAPGGPEILPPTLCPALPPGLPLAFSFELLPGAVAAGGCPGDHLSAWPAAAARDRRAVRLQRPTGDAARPYPRPVFAGAPEKNAFRYLRHYILPSPWVAEHWRE